MVQWRTPGGLRGKKNTDILQLPAHEKSAAVPFSGDDPSGSSVGRAAAQKEGSSTWKLGTNGVHDTQEAWLKGTELPDGTKVWDTGKMTGINGETGVRVHIDKKGNIHGYPVDPGRYLPKQ